METDTQWWMAKQFEYGKTDNIQLKLKRKNFVIVVDFRYSIHTLLFSVLTIYKHTELNSAEVLTSHRVIWTLLKAATRYFFFLVFFSSVFSVWHFFYVTGLYVLVYVRRSICMIRVCVHAFGWNLFAPTPLFEFGAVLYWIFYYWKCSQFISREIAAKLYAVKMHVLTRDVAISQYHSVFSTNITIQTFIDIPSLFRILRMLSTRCQWLFGVYHL